MTELEKWNTNESGIEKLEYIDNEISITLKQDSDIRVKIPAGIFQDGDIGIIKEEKITVKERGE